MKIDTKLEQKIEEKLAENGYSSYEIARIMLIITAAQIENEKVQDNN
jgi:SOS response regulatory protein OraA/RecX